MTLEIDIEEEVCRQALDLGVINFKVKAAGQRGWPDRCFLIPGGKPLFIEFKRPNGGVLSANQKVIIRRLKYYGYSVEVCDSVEAAIEIIKACLDAARLPKARRKVSS